MDEVRSTTLVSFSPEKMFDPSNKKNPLKTVIQSGHEYAVDTAHSKLLSFKSKRVTVFDVVWDFFEPKLKLEYSYFELKYTDMVEHSAGRDYCSGGSTTDFITGRCPIYFVMMFLPSGSLTKITRTYPKFLDSVGQIGGVAEIFMMVGGLIYAGYNSKKLTSYLREKLFGKKFVKDYGKFLHSNEGEREPSTGSKIYPILPEEGQLKRKKFNSLIKFNS